MAFVYAALGLVAILAVRALFREPKHRVIMNFHEVNNPAVLRAAALTNTSHRDSEPKEF
ncbi:MAG: hypothetical protein LN409_04575 [Candidatus Thermoplasmatota archaeon]|nr:hypothetical protein [Candidatus Thermoplasmatota archaeon]